MKSKTAAEWRRIFAHNVLPAWGERPLAEISKSDVLELVDDKAAMRERKRKGTNGGAAVQAGKMLTRLRTFFGWPSRITLRRPIRPPGCAGLRRRRSGIACWTITR